MNKEEKTVTVKTGDLITIKSFASSSPRCRDKVTYNFVLYVKDSEEVIIPDDTMRGVKVRVVNLPQTVNILTRYAIQNRTLTINRHVNNRTSLCYQALKKMYYKKSKLHGVIFQVESVPEKA